jgi:Holliday junction resolvasome RuvABC DNA-binding subunit
MGHEDTILSQFIAIALIVWGGYNYFKAKASGYTIDLDHVELFTIHDVEISRPLQKTVTAKKQKPKNKGYTDLQLDCMEALKSLGIKSKKEREYILHSIFNNSNPTTVQDFIRLAAGKMS